MKKTLLLFIALNCFFFANAQVTTNSGSGLNPTYADLDTAITALNGATITAPVIITLTGSETAPIGGYVITAQGDATNTIIIQGITSTIMASNGLTVGSVTDAIFKLVGADYITLQNFTMTENPANTVNGSAATNNMTEWGVALLYATTINGAQNNTIQGNTISLVRTYPNTFGIYSNVNHSATSVSNIPITASTGSNNGNKVYGNGINNVNVGISFIGSDAAAWQDTNNDIGGNSAATGNTITNWGGFATLTNFVYNGAASYCIYIEHQRVYNVSYNTITSASVSGTAVDFKGIFQDYTFASTGTFTNTISNNQITMTSGFASGVFQHIATIGGANAGITLNVINNTFLNSAVTGNSIMVGYLNSELINTLNVTGNTIIGWASGATTSGFSGFTSSTAIAGTINISNNKIGLGSTPAITFSAATSGVITGIANTNANSTATVNIKDNDIRGIVQNVSGSNTHNYITGTGTPLNLSVNNNTFTNITANTSGSVVFINANAVRPANSVCTVNNNSIVTAFSKSVSGGSITFYNSANASAPTSCIESNTGNNFSNITVIGTTSILGWINTNGSTVTPFGPTKTVTGNTFSTISAGTGAATLLTVRNGFATGNSVVSNNTITNITNSGTLIGILLAGGKQEFSSNTITGLTGIAVRGISITGGIQNLFKNKIAGLQGNTAAGLVYGIGITNIAGTSNIENNYVGNLSAPNANALDNIRGMSIAASSANTTFNIYHNTIYLNASSTGTDFGTTGIFHTSNATATTSKLDLRNNIIVNNSTANGTGRTVAYRRSSADLTNFASTSNNNDLFAPIIFADGANFDATLSAYKTRVASRDASSASVAPNFLSTTTSNGAFLHIDPSITTVLESNANVIPAVTTDFDNDIRQGAGGYSGTGTAPDIGADEFEGTTCALEPIVSTLISYTLGATATPLTATGTNLLWYTAATGGTGSTTAPTPSTASLGTTSYWVTQTVSGCESTRAKIDVLITVPATHLNFDGVNDNITFPELVSSDFSIEYWMKTTQIGLGGLQWYNGNGIVDAEVGGVTTDFGTSLVDNRLAFGIGDPVASDITIFSTSNVNTGNWVHVAATWKQATGAMKLYINGVLENTGTGGTGLRNGSATMSMGAILGNLSNYNGSIDEVRIWNNVLSLDDLVRRKNCELIGNESGLLAYYKFNQGLSQGNNTSVTTLTDSSMGGNNAALSNFALMGATSNWLEGSIVITGSLIPAAPTASPQTACTNATVADLVATGTNLLWYNVATGGTSLASNTAVVAGTYYVSSYNIYGCESTRTSVAVTLGNTTTWNGTIWDNGTPTSTSSAIISGNYSEAINLSACSLLVNNNAVVLVPTGYNFNISGAVIVDPSASLTFNNNSNLIQVKNVANTGNITVKRNSAALMRQDYTLWSSPVTGQQLQSFSPSTLATRFYIYDPSANLYVVISNPAATNFTAGTGFLIRMPNTHPTTPTVWNGTFTGVPNNGIVSLTVATATYNAIGNPYPSTIDADAFITANNITEALYFWRKTNNAATTSYATYTLAGGAGTGPNTGDPLGLVPNGAIQVGQGFIAKSTGTTLSFANTMRVANNGNQFLRTTEDRNRLWLNLTNATGLFSQTMVAYMPNATQGIDAAIDGRYFNDSPTALTSIINAEEFAIQGRALPFDANDIVPLGFKSQLAGNYTIALDHFDGLFTGSQDVFLKDNLTNTVHDLRAGSYNFAATAGVFNTRFEVIYQSLLDVNLPTFNENSVVVYKNNGAIHINSGVVMMDNVKVFDISGRLLAEKSKVNATETTIDSSKFGTQVLIVQITSDTQIRVSKKVVN